ncbi:hypothetical protein [uncultured Microbacterium sp.]|uniref:hypothetical protein n=1 Tax=uncultured Microbacterium sp. TaxID=191216 RepID=UPI0025E9463E|nr:hypothetical protein [uncultured Microbacterium sp.]
MPLTTIVQTVAQPSHAVDLDAVKLAAAKAVNSGATTSHGVTVESIQGAYTQAAGHTTTVHLTVRT